MEWRSRLRLAAVLTMMMVSAPAAVQAQAPTSAVAATATAAEAAAKSHAPATRVNAAPARPESGKQSDSGWMSARELVLSFAVLGFGLILGVQQTLVIMRRPHTAQDILRLFGLSSIVISTLFIITAGYGSEQIAPAMGLFGTVAGYILGRSEKTGAAS